MSRCHPGLPLLATLLAGAVVLGPDARPARAQWGLGYGGIFGGFNYVPSPGNFLNEQSNIRAARGPQARPTHSAYSGSPNAYFNRVRDNGLVAHYDVQSGGISAYRAAAGRPRRAAAAPAGAPAAGAPKTPVLPLASFFDASERLVWPGEAPVGGDLQGKRDLSDEASLAVLKESTLRQLASLSSVSLARQRLLDYGQPALQEVRRDQTPRIADSFHLFLLSLYESLAQAALPAPAPQP